MGFSIADATTVLDGAWFRVEQVGIQDAAGARHERHVLRHPGAVNVVAIDDQSRAILVRQYRATVDADVLEVVAGRRDVDGEAPERTAARELAEEAGLRAGRWVKLAEFWNSVGITDELSFSFLALDLEELGQLDRQGPEEQLMTIERVPLSGLESLIAAGQLRDAKSILGLTLARDYLAGRYPGWTA